MSEYNFVFTSEVLPNKKLKTLLNGDREIEVVGFISKLEIPGDELKKRLEVMDSAAVEILKHLIDRLGCFKGCDISDIGDGWGKIFIYGDDSTPLLEFKLTESDDERRYAEVNSCFKEAYQYLTANGEKFTTGIINARLFEKENCQWCSLYEEIPNQLKH